MDQTADVPVYNVCSAEAVTVRQLGETLARTLGVSTSLLRWGRLAYRTDERGMWIVGDNRTVLCGDRLEPAHVDRTGIGGLCGRTGWQRVARAHFSSLKTKINKHEY